MENKNILLIKLKDCATKSGGVSLFVFFFFSQIPNCCRVFFCQISPICQNIGLDCSKL